MEKSLPALERRWRGHGAGFSRAVLALAMMAGTSWTCTGTSTRSTGGTEVFAELPDTAPAARFIFVGDIGTGDDRARSVAAQIRRRSEVVPVSHVFLLGDNVYEHGSAQSIASKFLDVYRGVLTRAVRIHAALGNHDVERCRDSGLRPVRRDVSAYDMSPGCDVESHLATPAFGYPDGLRYYSIEIPGELPDQQMNALRGQDGARPEEPPLVEVFVLDSNTLGSEQTKLMHGTDEPQLRWLAEALQRSSARWKVVAMHHPVYAPKRCKWFRFACRDEDEALRTALEPIFREHGVDVVFQAHQHLYARLRPQYGIRYFVTGAGGKKADSFREDERTVPRRDRGSFNHFMYVRATEDQFGYCVIDANGDLRDRGVFAPEDAADRPIDPCSVPGGVSPPPSRRDHGGSRRAHRSRTGIPPDLPPDLLPSLGTVPSVRWAAETHESTAGLPNLEMALHEEDERRAPEGELWRLERAWREAEETGFQRVRISVCHCRPGRRLTGEVR